MTMLATLFVVIVTYLLAAESFTDFLFRPPARLRPTLRQAHCPARFSIS